MMQELKSHQQDLLRNLKSEIRDGILETLDAFNIQNAQNQESTPPIYNTNTQEWMQPYYALCVYPPVQTSNETQSHAVEQDNMFGMNKPTDPTIVLLLQQMK